MAELVHAGKEHSDWFSERFKFCYRDRYYKMDPAAHEVISLICVLEKIIKWKHFGVK